MTIKTVSQFETVNQFEQLLGRKEYRAIPRINTGHFSAKQKEQKQAVEGVVHFGSKVAVLFETMEQLLGRIPTPQEYMEASEELYHAYWQKHRSKSNKIKGLPLTDTVKLCMRDRISRAYMSKIVEMHTELLLQELGYKTISSRHIDTYLGVDMIAEGRKRFYIHITSSYSGRAGALLSIKQKEKRGGREYPRDFSGDVVLVYDGNGRFNDGSTKLLNGFPLFNKGYVDEELLIAQISKSHGEPLDAAPSKLSLFEEWLASAKGIKLEVS